jgi:hypothetical protein
MARYDFRLSWAEFEEITPGEFHELAKRRNVAIRYERYASALTAAAVYNVHRGSVDDQVVAAYDFVRPEAEAIKLEKVREGKRHINKVICGLPMTTTRAKLLDVRRKAIIDLKASGYQDPEAMFNECWPHLKPTEEESKA